VEVVAKTASISIDSSWCALPLLGILSELWTSFTNLSITDVLVLLSIGLVFDLGWGYLARLVGTLRERGRAQHDFKEKEDLEAKRAYLTTKIDESVQEINGAEEESYKHGEELNRLEQPIALTLHDYEPRLCPYCKTRNFENARYCDRCGSALDDKLTVQCPNCGAASSAGTRYCRICGTVLPRLCQYCKATNLDYVDACVRCNTDLLRVERELPETIAVSARKKMEEEREDEKGRIQKKVDASKTEIIRLRSELEETRAELNKVVHEIATREEETHPFVSVILPCHNSEGVIEETLHSLMTLDYERKQIVVVDDASTDRTYELASKYTGRVTLAKHAVSTGRKAGAINYGLNFSKGNVIVVVDDDTLLRPDAINNMVLGLADEKIGAVAGNVKVKAEPYNLLARLQSTEYLVNMELGRPFQDDVYRGLFVISGCFGAFRRDLLQKIGEYDADIIAEDLDVTWKLYKLKSRVAYREDAMCYTDAPTSLGVLYRQRRRWDKGLFEVLSKHRNMLLNRKFGPAGLLLLPDTIFHEVLLLFLRPAWIVYLGVFRYPILPALVVTTFFYIALEFVETMTAGLLSDSKINALKACYAPLMFVYRQFLGLVRLSALASHLSGRKMRW